MAVLVGILTALFLGKASSGSSVLVVVVLDTYRDCFGFLVPCKVNQLPGCGVIVAGLWGLLFRRQFLFQSFSSGELAFGWPSLV